MTARDELARAIEEGGWPEGSEHFYPGDAADAVIAAGWRKMPSREALIAALNEPDTLIHDSGQPQVEFALLADAILALMDGNTNE